MDVPTPTDGTDEAQSPMRSVNERFAGHVRSASFHLTLSHAQIRYLLRHATVNELRVKYAWYTPGEANFGTAVALATQWSTPTVRSLVRRGMLDVEPLDPPCSFYDVVRLTDAGVAVVELLGIADFKVDPDGVPKVPLHPDDRSVLHSDLRTVTRVDQDRRDPADAPFLSGKHKATVDA